MPDNALSPLITHTNSNSSNDNPPQCKATVKKFARAINDWSATHGTTNSAVNDLLGILRDFVPGIQLPLNAKDKIPFNDKIISTNAIAKYMDSDLKDFSVDICRRECMVYQGMQTIVNAAGKILTENCSLLLRCAVCNDARFTKCNHKTCVKNKTQFECDPFIGKGAHSVLYRVPMKRVHYRSALVKLIQF